MKNQRSKILITILLAIAILVSILQVTCFAANSNMVIVKQSENQYLIYSDKITSEDYSFAFGNSSDATELNYIRVISDGAGNYVAYVDSELMSKFFNSENTYIWVKTNEEIIINGEQITLDEATTIDSVNQISNITNNITIETSSAEDEKIKINGTEGETYYYQFFNVSSSEDYTNLVSLINEASNYDDGTSMYQKLQTYIKLNDLYTSLLKNLEESNWAKTENLEITKPYAATQNQQYVLWLKDENGNIDIQILTAYEKIITVTSQKATTENVLAALPYTYDEITNFIIALGVVILAIVAIIILKKVSKNEKE